MSFSITINGAAHVLDDALQSATLLEYLHEEAGLTGTKLCCGIAVCRACTVSVQRGPSGVSEPILACSTPLGLLKEAKVTTIEAVAVDGKLSATQTAFLKHFSFQCEYCAPGFVMAAEIFLQELARQPVPEAQLDDAIVAAIGEHICRCTGYVRYFEAVKEVALAQMAAKQGAAQ